VRIRAEISYDVPPAEVFAMLVDPAFQERKLAATGSLTWSVTVRPGEADPPDPDGTARVSSRRTLPTDRIPELFRAAVGSELTLVQTEEWARPGPDGARTGQLHIEVPGLPLTLTGALSLSPDGDGTRYLVDGELKAKVPLIGGKIEKAAEPAVRAAIDAEEQVGRDWLADA
jgi:hypothetical protein